MASKTFQWADLFASFSHCPPDRMILASISTKCASSFWNFFVHEDMKFFKDSSGQHFWNSSAAIRAGSHLTGIVTVTLCLASWWISPRSALLTVEIDLILLRYLVFKWLFRLSRQFQNTFSNNPTVWGTNFMQQNFLKVIKHTVLWVWLTCG